MRVVERLTLVITCAVLLVWLVGCGGGRQAPQSTPPLIPPTTTPEPTAIPPWVFQTPPNLGSGWEGSYAETDVAVGMERTYAHYPQSYIRYDELTVDDVLLKATFVCFDQPYDITDMFALESEPGETPARYKSWAIQCRPECRIEFTIKNTAGATMGLTFTAHCPICLEEKG